MIRDHLQQTENGINYYSKTYENFILIGDFNAEISDTIVDSFCAIHKFKRLRNFRVAKILKIQPA